MHSMTKATEHHCVPTRGLSFQLFCAVSNEAVFPKTSSRSNVSPAKGISHLDGLFYFPYSTSLTRRIIKTFTIHLPRALTCQICRYSRNPEFCPSEPYPLLSKNHISFSIPMSKFLDPKTKGPRNKHM